MFRQGPPRRCSRRRVRGLIVMCGRGWHRRATRRWKRSRRRGGPQAVEASLEPLYSLGQRF